MNILSNLSEVIAGAEAGSDEANAILSLCRAHGRQARSRNGPFTPYLRPRERVRRARTRGGHTK